MPKIVLIMDVQENPDSLSVRLLADRLLRDKPDSLVVMGGDSALDTAKAANLLAFCGGLGVLLPLRTRPTYPLRQ